MTINDVLNKLNNVRKSATGYTARCPSHDDRSNSLSVREGDDGRVLIHCFVGCCFKDIATSMGLNPSDFFKQ